MRLSVLCLLVGGGFAVPAVYGQHPPAYPVLPYPVVAPSQPSLRLSSDLWARGLRLDLPRPAFPSSGLPAFQSVQQPMPVAVPLRAEPMRAVPLPRR